VRIIILKRRTNVKKIVVGLVLALLLVGAMTASAESSVFAVYNKPGHLNAYGSVGFYGFWGLEATVGAEMIIGKFDLGPVPLQWGVMARGLLAFPFFLGSGWLDWGAAPLVSLHTGFNFGKSLEFDVYIALGLGLYGTTGTYYSTWNPINVGFASFDGVAWKLSDKWFLLGEYGYVGSTSVYGIGVEMKL
jgi:hypothetical protein